ncbi:MAG: 50S ribosomal protein L3 [Gammaproteobacteria bacterium]|nr:50S ribosomal protein L3 [Gammaproteobacteria bacterium]
MTIGLIGRKIGMTRVFTDQGSTIPVSVIHVESNRVAQIKTPEADGYGAVQVTCGTRRPSRVTKSQAGHYAKAGIEAGRGLWEFRLGENENDALAAGNELRVDLFEAGQKVDVTGITKGKGFAGTIKRYNFHMQDATHGNSLAHRAPGSIGQRQTPGRVPKGKKMAGHMGVVRRVTQNLEVVRVYQDRNLLLIKGAIPGSTGGNVIVCPAIKAKTRQATAQTPDQ